MQLSIIIAPFSKECERTTLFCQTAISIAVALPGQANTVSPTRPMQTFWSDFRPENLL